MKFTTTPLITADPVLDLRPERLRPSVAVYTSPQDPGAVVILGGYALQLEGDMITRISREADGGRRYPVLSQAVPSAFSKALATVLRELDGLASDYGATSGAPPDQGVPEGGDDEDGDS